MNNFAKYIEEFTGEPIQFVVIGDDRFSRYFYEIPNWDDVPKFQLLDWKEGKKWLDFETTFDEFGSAMQPPICAWSENYVIGISEYDGTTALFKLPRNPIAFTPPMPGGG